jgi:hypothetical protein
LRKIFRRKGDEVTGELRKIYNEELNALYTSPNIIILTQSYKVSTCAHTEGTVRQKTSPEGHPPPAGTIAHSHCDASQRTVATIYNPPVSLNATGSRK